MALYKAQIFHTETGDRFWTNVYHFNVTTLLAAGAFANEVIAPGHASLMSDEFRVVKTLISDPASDEFLTTPMDLQGEITGADHLQLFNTIKVNVSVEGFGRNDYKFYRGVVFENNANLGVLLPGTVDAWDALINSFITDGTAAGCDLVDSVGNNWLVASTQRNVQMRQLHRKRKKKVVTP